MQAWEHDIPTRYFATYETLEAAFRERVAGLVPRYHAGTRVFWNDFQRLYDAPATPAEKNGEVYITSNPRDCLAFGTPIQVLRGAWLTVLRDNAVPPDSPEAAAARFGLEGHLHQSIRSLSGGETVRLALAKAYLLAASATRLTVASPFSWLAIGHWNDFRRLAAHYRSCGKPLELFALQGEDVLEAAESDIAAGPATLPFAWQLQDLTVDLGSLMDRLQDRRVTATITSREERLLSPCLLSGGNGQGKSLLAKALAAAIPSSGKAVLSGSNGPLRVRLLFQDVLNQTLMRTLRQMTSPKTDRELASVYDAIAAGIRRRHAETGKTLKPLADRRRDRVPLRLLEIKMLLAAARLAEPHAALILDEPDWGLSRSDALALVAALVEVAHARSAPVLLISHKPWWRHLAGSVRRVCKAAGAPSGAQGDLFHIDIRKDAGGAP